MLESLEQSNIKKMSMENPESKPEADFFERLGITDAETADLKQQLNESSHGLTSLELGDMIIQYEILFPDELRPERNHKFLHDNMHDELIGYARTDKWEKYAHMAYLIQTLFPQARGPMPKGIADKLSKKIGGLDWGSNEFLESLFHFRQINPAEGQAIAEASWAHSFAALVAWLDADNLRKKANPLASMRDKFAILTKLRLAYPEKIKILALDKSELEAVPRFMREYLPLRHFSAVEDEELLAQIKIVTADELRVSLDGIEATQTVAKNLDQPTPPRPEERNF